MNDVVTLIQRGDEYGVEVDGPDAVTGFFKSNVVVDQRIRDVEQLVLEAKRSAGGDLLDVEVPRILDRW